MNSALTSSQYPANEVDGRKGITTVSPEPILHPYQASNGRIIELVSVIEWMKHQESTVYRVNSYLDHAKVTAQDRMDLCKWGCDLVDACNINRKVATIGITYFDRFLGSQNSRSIDVCLADQREFQLAFIVSEICVMVASFEISWNRTHLQMCAFRQVDLHHPRHKVSRRY